MQVAFYLVGEITQVLDALPWIRCASGNVYLIYVLFLHFFLSLFLYHHFPLVDQLSSQEVFTQFLFFFLFVFIFLNHFFIIIILLWTSFPMKRFLIAECVCLKFKVFSSQIDDKGCPPYLVLDQLSSQK